MIKEVFELFTGAIKSAAEDVSGKMAIKSEVGDYMMAGVHAQDLACFYKFLDDLSDTDDVDKLRKYDDWGFIKWWVLDGDGFEYITEYAHENGLEDYEDLVLGLFD